MVRRVRVFTAVILCAVLLATSPGSPATAQEAPPQPAPEGVEPEIFVPGAINRVPEADTIPTAGNASEGQTGIVAPGDEVVERRTEDSRTFVTEDGGFETTFYGGAVNYRDAHGAWQPIDNSLVPAEGGNGALRNAAGPVEVSLPAVLGAEAVRVTKDDISVGFRLNGANAPPSAGTPKALPPPASEAAVKASATYANSIPGVDVSYTAMPEGVKEELVLAGPDAPTSFDFTVEATPGLTATQTAGGGIDFVDGEGNAKATFAPPFAYDASFRATGAHTAFTDDAVSLTIVQTSPALVVRLAADEAWLAAPERVWPVVLDPTLTISGFAHDSYLSKSYPTTNYGSASHLVLAAGSSARRPIYRKPIQNSFDEPVIVTGAVFEVYADIYQLSPVSPVAAHAVTQDWGSLAATWNQRLSGVAWNSPGGDFASPAVSVNPDASGPGFKSWDITKTAQAWVDGEANHGLILKHVDEVSGAYAYFISSDNSQADFRPRTVVRWQPLAGVRSPYSFEEFDLGPAGEASVNVASGNLTLADRDLAIAGTGLDATVDRFYQSRIATMGSVGARWRMWPQSEERLYVLENGDVGLAGGPEELLMFSANPDGSYTSPHGYRGTLTKATDGSFSLLSHGDGTRHNFYSTGHTKDITDRNGNKITVGYTYDSASGDYFMSRMTDTQARNTTFERAGEYKVTKMTDPAGRTHTYAYDRTDANANLASYTDPAGAVTRYAYTGTVLGLLSRVTDANGNATAFTYDSRDRVTALTRISDPATGTGPTWTFSYATRWQTKVTDPNGNATVHHFDRRGRVTKVVDALGHIREARYDANSNVEERTSATGAKSIDKFHPVTSNPESSQLPTGAEATFKHEDPNHTYSLTSYTNPQGNSWKLTYYPGVANVKTVEDSMPTVGVTSFVYNTNGTVASSTNAKGVVTTYGYDASGNRIKVTPPAPLGATTIAYDGLSRVTSVTDGKGQVTTYAYDLLDRPTQINAGGIVVTLRYDAGGRMFERADPTGTTTYVHDRLNRVVEERLPGIRTNGYSYDGVGNLKTMTDTTGVVTYGYNAVNLVNSLVEPGGATTTFGYDNDDNRTLTTYPNGVSQEAKYDASGRLTTIDGKRGTTLLTHFFYTYKLGTRDTVLRQTVTDKDNRVTTYGYDALDRLKQAQTKAGTSVVADYGYDYDPVGNRTLEKTNGTSITPTFNNADQLTSRAGVTYSYDPNGNQTGSSAGQALAYNGADQTTSLKRAGGTALAASYAGTNQVERATAGSTTFTNSMLGLSVATDTSATAYTRDPGGGLVGMRGANRSYYLFDGLGSVVAVTDVNGAVTNTYTYDPYGVTTETKATGTNVVNPWRYAGQYQDITTGLYKMGARYYQPELGRWTQQDPSASEPNRYAYVAGNPVNFTDPSGLSPVSWIYDAIGLKDALEDALDEDETARDLLDNLAGGAANVAFATACAYFAGLLGLATGGVGGLIGGSVCATLSAAAGALVENSIGDG